ncbi:MAG: DUF4829 domain-containing protein [Proteobacteria bacterium]|nr:DUF4829 domain-containing protein [Pseudomonadota bacterium]
MISKYTFPFLVVMICCLLTACGAGNLQTKDFNQPYYFSIDEEAKISDSDENMEILKTVQKYRDAISNKDIGTLRSMISSDYYENASTTDDLTDDYGNERIEEILSDYLSQSVKDIRYIIQIKQLTKEGMEYHVDYQYIWNFRYEVAGQSYWQSKNDTNRMTLVRENNEWKIKGGL